MIPLFHFFRSNYNGSLQTPLSRQESLRLRLRRRSVPRIFGRSSQTNKMVPVTDQSSIVISLQVDSRIHSPYGVIRKFLMQVRRDRVRSIGDLEKKIQLDLGITNNIGLFYANEFYMLPDVELSVFEGLGTSSLISVRPIAAVKFSAGQSTKQTQTEGFKMEEEEDGNYDGSGNPEADGDSGMSDSGEENDCISKNHTSYEQDGQIGIQNVETAAEKRKDSEDSVLSLEQATSSASLSSCESASPLSVDAASISLDSSILASTPYDTATMSPRRQTPTFGPVRSAVRRKITFTPFPRTPISQRGSPRKQKNSSNETPKWWQKQSLPVAVAGDYSEGPSTSLSRQRALENLTNTTGGTAVMQNNMGLTNNQRSGLETGDEIGVEKGIPTGPENDTTIADSDVSH